MQRSATLAAIKLPDGLLSRVADVARSLFTLEGTSLSLSGQKLTEFPSFKGKRRNDVQLVDFVTSLDVSVNKLRYVLTMQLAGSQPVCCAAEQEKIHSQTVSLETPTHLSRDALALQKLEECCRISEAEETGGRSQRP
jgi:hypothetical protein